MDVIEAEDMGGMAGMGGMGGMGAMGGVLAVTSLDQLQSPGAVGDFVYRCTDRPGIICWLGVANESLEFCICRWPEG